MPKDIRDAFFDRICEYANKDTNVVIITDDMDIFSLRRFREIHPDRFINPGVAEQQIINLAAGLAASGKKVIVCGIASFVTYRCYEQIRVNIASMNLPVVVVGMGVGLSFAFDGPTHHSIQDISVMRSIPEFEVYNPSGASSAEACADIAYHTTVPVYIRIDKGTLPDVYTNKKFYLSYGHREIMVKNAINVISTGITTHLAQDILPHLGFDVGLFDVFKLKPFDEQLIRDLNNSRGIVTIEEHAITGGLRSIVLEELSNNEINIPVKGLALKDGQYLDYGTREFLQDKYGLNRDKIITEITNFRKKVCISQ